MKAAASASVANRPQSIRCSSCVSSNPSLTTNVTRQGSPGSFNRSGCAGGSSDLAGSSIRVAKAHTSSGSRLRGLCRCSRSESRSRAAAMRESPAIPVEQWCGQIQTAPPHSTPSLIERPLTGAHHHASPSTQRTPSRVLFAVSQINRTPTSHRSAKPDADSGTAAIRPRRRRRFSLGTARQ
jgi:hypothetical protein